MNVNAANFNPASSSRRGMQVGGNEMDEHHEQEFQQQHQYQQHAYHPNVTQANNSAGNSLAPSSPHRQMGGMYYPDQEYHHHNAYHHHHHHHQESGADQAAYHHHHSENPYASQYHSQHSGTNEAADYGYFVPSGASSSVGDTVGYHHHHQQQQHHPTPAPNPAVYHRSNSATGAETTTQTSTGEYYPLPQQQYFLSSSPSVAAPSTTTAVTPPISALAYDDCLEAIYVASHTLPFGERPRRASMLVTFSTPSGGLFSSCAGHPEASSSTLSQVYQTFFGAKTISTSTATNTNRHHLQASRIPPHAYQPPFGNSAKTTPATALGPPFQMGITKLISLSSRHYRNPSASTMGHILSISPSGVRTHSSGGLCLCDAELSGMVCGTLSSHDGHYAMVAGVNDVYCLDIYRNLRIVSSTKKTVTSQALSPTQQQGSFSCRAMDWNPHKQTVVAGCSDGTVRLLDGRVPRKEVGKIKSHAGGVTDLNVSSDGSLIVTTGFTARSSLAALGTSASGSAPTTSTTYVPYAFPDPHVLIYDCRYLGLGGLVHPFSGVVKGGPRFVSFLPNVQGQPNNRVMAVSGQPQGGMQIIVPFDDQETSGSNTSSTRAHGKFLFPHLVRDESMTCLSVHEDKVAVGTNMGNVLQFEMAGYAEISTKTRTSTSGNPVVDGGGSSFAAPQQKGSLLVSHPTGETQRSGPALIEKQPLEMPGYPEMPEMSIDPKILLKKPSGLRGGGTHDQIKAVFNTYIMCANPTVSTASSLSFGPIARNPFVPSPKLALTSTFDRLCSQSDDGMAPMVPASNFGIDLLASHSADTNKVKSNRIKKRVNETGPLANPNKLLYCESLGNVCYRDTNRRRGRRKGGAIGNRDMSSMDEIDDGQIPERYRLNVRPSYVSTTHFDHSTFNSTNLWPGWDYPPCMPSSHAPPVLLLLYFVPEVRSSLLERQFDNRLYSSKSVESVPPLSTEMSFLFHNLEAISQNAFTYPGSATRAKMGVFVPSNFLATFTVMPEASNLALLDNNPAVADKARRPEAFYRFLLYQLDKESKKTLKKLMDSLHGLNFVSANEFITGSGPPSYSSTRAMTVDLAYEPFLHNTKEPKKFRFGQVLQHALCRETRLRAWCKATKSYETIVQRKIASSLPEILSLSCACAGRKEEDGLSVWRTSFDNFGHWLPEMIEVELEEDGNVTVRELIDTEDGKGKWETFEGKSTISSKITELVQDNQSTETRRKIRYRLDAVLSFVRDDMDPQYNKMAHAGSSGTRGGRRSSNDDDEDDDKPDGHHILHMRVPSTYKKRALTRQKEQADQLVKFLAKARGHQKHTLVGSTDSSVVKTRSDTARDQLKGASDEWTLFNGFVVTKTEVEDARAFHVAFKEPCLVIFRAVCNEKIDQKMEPVRSDTQALQGALFSRSISSNRPSKYSVKSQSELPGKGDLVAFDAEFVSVQEEESILTDSGNKLVVRETRHALARISMIDGRTGKIVLDDHVMPREPVVDYLTRFSGIVEGDLDPKTSPHHLISARTAYLKLRYFQERGCIFVGHGLSQDFLTANLCVPSCQIIDTVELYHRDQMRHISLRFLANYVLGRDMQTDVHDSIEDAKAALDLYQYAVNNFLGLSMGEEENDGEMADSEVREVTKELNPEWEKFLNELYEHGQKTSWRIGVPDDEARR